MSLSVFTPGRRHAEGSLLLSLNLPETLPEAHSRISGGLSAQILRQTASLSTFDESSLLRMSGIDRNTYSRRLKSEQAFSPEQSGRVYMMIRVLSAAGKLFNGDMTRAAEWLDTPAKGLGGKKPAEFTSTPPGAEAVINLIGQIEHGVIT
ncbi:MULTISPECIES: antitoxin Xre/MbcA/ParS toxin-binding domain-containing protein [Erwinia]|uniref:type II RES/Xre toxin-antitoxin system antitoxin n=1 Tax=Erwinia TaxID=551 RepID=UPI000556EB39|nr:MULTISPECIES: antitoxin Xre/MbcA/ParS toxin-binding domain-containing protein [Erwinia]